MKSIRVILLLLLLGLAPVWGEGVATSSTGTGFKLEHSHIRVLDAFGRPYLSAPETAWLGVRLSRADDLTPSIKDYKSLATEGLQYDVDSEAWSFFPLVDGAADAQFVVFDDPSKNPINYDLGLFERSSTGGKKLTAPFKEPYQAGREGVTSSLMKIQAKRPLITTEKVLLASFVIITTLISYLLLGRELFRRMLFHKRMEVESALTASNTLVLLFLLLTITVALCVYIYPYIYWDSIYGVYALATLGYVAVLVVVYAIGAIMTRSA